MFPLNIASFFIPDEQLRFSERLSSQSSVSLSSHDAASTDNRTTTTTDVPGIKRPSDKYTSEAMSGKQSVNIVKQG